MSFFFNLNSTPTKKGFGNAGIVKSPSTPFCTTPSQLQEVTLDPDATFSSTLGLRSPSGGAPWRGRTVKEFEEQMSDLKKENFNLKLRIYFLEEKLGTHFTLDNDNIVKKNIDLQIEVSSLQKEVREKHELLCQAVKAIELEEEEHKKYSQSKEDQIAQMQQELEDLRIQIHDVNTLESGIHSVLSLSPTNPSTSRDDHDNFHSLDDNMLMIHHGRKSRHGRDYASHVKSINDQDHAQVIYEHNRALEDKVAQLQRDCHSKDDIINQINRELESANERLVEYAQQIKEYEQKLCQAHQVKQNLVLQLQDNKKQMEDLKQKYVTTKYDLENDLEKLRKEGDKTKMMKDMRISMLENETEKHKIRIRDLQGKLEAAVAEAKKNQNLAVPSSTVADPATPGGAAEKGALHIPLEPRSPESKSSSIKVPPTPDGRSVASFEEMILCGDPQPTKLIAEFQQVKEEMGTYRKKIVKLKSEQLKACEIIQNMLKMRDKSTQEMDRLKKEKEELEKKREDLEGENKKLTTELEMVVSKPDREVRPLSARIAELNIAAGDVVSTPPCERAIAAALDAHYTPEEGMDVTERYRALTDELESKIEVLMATLQEKDNRIRDIKDQYDQILSMLVEKENRIVDLEFELLSNQESGRGSLLEKGDYSTSEKHASFYKEELTEKNKEIERLTVELKKCNCHLQSIVNKELWDKNRQIEKMQIKTQSQTPELLKLRKSLSAKELQLQALKEKISELGLDVTLPNDCSFDSNKNNSSPKTNIEEIKSLEAALQSANEEKCYFESKVAELEKQSAIVDKLYIEREGLLTQLENSEKLRLESNDISTALANRLEELAVFLDSLLQQKSVLGFLGAAKNKRLRDIINSSLDMSRSLSMSLIDNPDQSLTQLTNITALLNGSVYQELSLACEGKDEEEQVTNLSIVPSNITLTYESHLSYKKVNIPSDTEQQTNNEHVIAALREQVFNLKGELKVRDNELNRLQEKIDIESGVEKLTGTEEEPKDANSSKLFTSQNKSLTPRSHTLTLTPKSNTSNITLRQKERCDIQSESDAWSEPDRAVSRARIGLQESSLAPPTPRLSRIIYNESTEDDETGIGISPAKKRLSLVEMHNEILRLEQELDQKIEESCAEKQMYLEKLQEMEQDIKSMKQKLVAAQNEEEKAETQVQMLQKTVEELSAIKEQYETNSKGQTKELLNKLNEIEAEKNELLKKCSDFEKQAVNARNEVISAEEKLKNMEQQMENKEQELRTSFEQTLVSKLKNAEDVFTNKIRQVEEMYEQELNKAKESVKHIQEECKRDYVKKTAIEKKLQQFEHLTTELHNLKSTVESYEKTINSYKHKEQELSEIIQDYQEKTNALRRDLDNTTLQYSEAVLEKTKLCNDKAFLEQELNRVNSKEIELENKISEMIFTQDEQITTLQAQKSTLELKISELESKNAELRNKLVKMQVEKCNLNRSLPTISSNLMTYQRQYSDRAQYSSEENGEELPSCYGSAQNMASNVNLNVRNANVDAERTVANSSPDLGIESDHGRFSSLETQTTNNQRNDNGNNVANRPLLESIQITECMNEMFDQQNNQLEATVAPDDHCCQKSQEIIQENNDLKRKLLRMKRALEDTTTQLTLANQRKKQVEKTICKQIHKTSQVLRKAKANLDSGSEF